MSTIRLATIDDATLVTQQRHRMFADANYASEERLNEMDAAFELWVRGKLADGSYAGWFLEEGGAVVAGAGLYVMEFPPGWIDTAPVRGYLLNFYTEPEHRRRGYAAELLQVAIGECRRRGIVAITLHASKFGQPIYERAGFVKTNEMMLRLE